MGRTGSHINALPTGRTLDADCNSNVAGMAGGSAAMNSKRNAYPVLISIADAWQIVAAGLVEVMELLRGFQTPSLLLK